MTSKTKNIVSIVVGALPAAMVLMSAIMKLTANPELVASMSKGGFGPYIPVFGTIEIISLILFFIPKTKKLGFYLLCSYLGGACAVELSMGSHMPVSAILLAGFWISMFINDKTNFLPASTNTNN